ncbi:MAG: PilZ protein [Acidobacteria bacterium]|nr:PilZ protein [Acidobacteriota bacterium]
MPELARSIAARLRKYFGDRRRAERLNVQLPFAVSLWDKRPDGNASQRYALDGHTLDISATGLALLVPAIRIGDHYLAGEGRGLRIELALPLGPIVIQATAVRYERLDEVESEKGYLIGVNITAMSDPDRASYDEYLSGLPSR